MGQQRVVDTEPLSQEGAEALYADLVSAYRRRLGDTKTVLKALKSLKKGLIDSRADFMEALHLDLRKGKSKSKGSRNKGPNTPSKKGGKGGRQSSNRGGVKRKQSRQ
ncbi:hypothetical protein KIPB_001098 [Kipferlia bialata]|uniref:Uncharacterized protein n=1 Tax=Kipferlia bialata TaxID=797122 RepID=A0A9K3CQ57_9EUKA|nr:hypothetical protein KIPB_001098 [Kipferlia bialata]|eukprot:g1098.t1